MKHPHAILLIMSELQEQIQGSQFLFKKLRSLQKLIKFSELIRKFVIRAADNEQIEQYKAYFVKDVVLFMLNVACVDLNIPNSVKIPILSFVHQFIQQTVEHCCRMYKDNLNRIVSLLVDLAMANKADEDSVLCNTIVDIVKQFFVDNRQLFADTLGTIDILPESHLSFDEVATLQLSYAKTTIAEEIERFLAVPKRSVHSLRYLRRKISDHEREFIKLFQELKQGLRNIPNTDNLAHKLVLALLLCIKEDKEEVSIRRIETRQHPMMLNLKKSK